MSGLLRIFFLLMIVLAVLSMVRGMLSPAKSTRNTGARRDRTTRSGKLFQDPVCGTYVTAGDSPRVTREGQAVYFCSDECREKFEAGK